MKQTGELDYFKLIKEVKKLSFDSSFKKIRVALLADFATQHLSAVLKALAAKQRIQIEIYEGVYDGIELEVFDPNSQLYQFDPDFILFLNSTEKLRSKYMHSSLTTPAWLEEKHEKIVSLWAAAKERSRATVIQSTFVVPHERIFGNYDKKVRGTFSQSIGELNQLISTSARDLNHVLVLDVDHLAGYVGRKHWFSEKLWALSKEPCALENIPLYAQNILDILSSSGGKVVKCVVLDLDNTLWGGVIGDDGVEGIALGDLGEGEVFVEFQRFILALKQRGIILAVCSKNEHSNAVLPFQKHPEMVLKESDIAVFVANWDNKADNIRHIQKTLNIGLDSMVFLDDNPFERNLVREMLPEVIVPELPEDPALYVRAICELNLFETTTFSNADLERGDMYRVEAQRTQLKTNFSRIEDYLKSLEMGVSLQKFNPFNLPRIAQLIQRSNQFNLATNRYSESDCEAFGKNQGYFPFSLSLKDKFGDYGLISVIILKLSTEEVEIDEYLMSCRVLQRGVENFAMNSIFDLAKKLSVSRVKGKFIPTEKNAMVKEFYQQFGFTKNELADGSSEWVCEVNQYQPKPVYIETIESAIVDFV